MESGSYIVRILATCFGMVLIGAGIMGFVPNVLLGRTGFFESNVSLSMFHVLTGIILVLSGRIFRTIQVELYRWYGVGYAFFSMIGFVFWPSGGAVLGFLETNVAGHWLHLAIGVCLFSLSEFLAEQKIHPTPLAKG